MKQPLFLKNTPIDEERISYIETVVSRLARRSRKNATAMIPPCIVSDSAVGGNVSGTILQYMFPCNGVVTRCLVNTNKLKNEVTVKINLINEKGKLTQAYGTEKGRLFLDIKYKINQWDKLTICVCPNNDTEEEMITEAWASFIWNPEKNVADVKKILIDQLENELNERKVR